MASLAIAPAVTVRRGAREWVRSYRTMTRWEFTGLRLMLPLVIVVEVLIGAGFVLGFALFFREIPYEVALYVSTGVPVINLILLGLIVGPQIVADQKMAQGYEYLRTIPTPRTAAAFAWFTVALVGALPGVAVGLAVAVLRYDLQLAISPAIVPALIVTAFTGTMMGYAIAHAIRDAMTVRLVTQLLVFVTFGFVPIMFPVERLPGWLGATNWWFPFRHMAVIVRAGLTDGLVTGVASSYAVVLVWGVVAAALAAFALGRRR
jgi:ABC-2 type transport system permease protein